MNDLIYQNASLCNSMTVIYKYIYLHPLINILVLQSTSSSVASSTVGCLLVWVALELATLLSALPNDQDSEPPREGTALVLGPATIGDIGELTCTTGGVIEPLAGATKSELTVRVEVTGP